MKEPDSYFSPSPTGYWRDHFTLSRAIEADIGALISCAQQSRRNRNDRGRSEYVRWRTSHRWCGKRIARILAMNKPDDQ